MWTHGLIYGFITRAETERFARSVFFFPPMKTHACLELLNRMLALMQPGSFIIRFSERNAGQLVVVYKNGKEEVRYDTLHPLSLTPLKHTMHVITTNLWLQALSGY